MMLDSYAYSNRWRRVHPVEKGLLALLCLVATLVARSPVVPLAIFAVMSGLIVFGARIPAVAYLRLLVIPVGFLIFGAISLMVSFSGGEIPLARLPMVDLQIALSLTGIRQAETTLARSLGAVSCLYFLALTTPMTEIVGLLRRLGLPALFLELMILAYRHIFIFLKIAQEMTVAQSSRLGYSTTRNSFRSLAALGGNLFLRALRRSRQLHQALLARGYQDDLRYLEDQHAWSPRNLVGGTMFGAAFLSLSIFLPG